MSMTAQEYAELMPDGGQLLSDEPEMESSLHYAQLALLVSCLEWFWRDRDDFFIGANLTVYYSHEQLRHRDFRGPDFFLFKNTERRPRNSWVVWEEGGRYPDVIIELLSSSTELVDRTTKKLLYQDHFSTEEYFWFHPETLELAGFRLVGGTYRPILGDDRDWRYSEQLGLFLGVHEGQLRYFSENGELIATAAETAQQEVQHARQACLQADRAQAEASQAQAEASQAQAEAGQAQAKAQQAESEAEEAKSEAQAAKSEAQQVQARADQEHRRAEALAEKLRALGIDPD
jgi:Uma2 family endonuclease